MHIFWTCRNRDESRKSFCSAFNQKMITKIKVKAQGDADFVSVAKIWCFWIDFELFIAYSPQSVNSAATLFQIRIPEESQKFFNSAQRPTFVGLFCSDKWQPFASDIEVPGENDSHEARECLQYSTPSLRQKPNLEMNDMYWELDCRS